MKKVKTIGIVSLSSGILGEDFVQHEVKIGLERLEKLGIQVKFMEHACKGLKYISEHPKDRASDLLNRLQRYAESSGWKLDKERSGVEYFVGYKDIEGRKYQVSVGIGDEKVVYVSVEGLGN